MSKPIVTVKQGQLQGVRVKSVLGSSYIAFRGIPFALPPVGNLRFKDPQPLPPWTGIKQATDSEGYFCPQLLDIQPFGIVCNEDCLYLNVYTNSFTQSKPVMFYIHGGSFLVGSSSFQRYRADYLLPKDVVVVTTNYRLGAFGFLNLGHRDAAGNQGLKDVIAALEWVQENISNFGGNPKNVTVFGASAGAVLSHALLVSPRARGLFHKMIIQSGTLNCTWNSSQSESSFCFKLASFLGNDSTDPVETLKFLRTVSAKDIVRAQKLRFLGPSFGPICDEIAENPVLPEPIEQLIMKPADVPLIISHTARESLMFVADTSVNAIKAFNALLREHIGYMAKLKNLNSEEIEKLVLKVEDWYFSGGPVTKENLDKYLDLITDTYFSIPARIIFDNQIKCTNSPKYFCVYSYIGKERTLTDVLGQRIMPGASHVDDVAYLFYQPFCKTKDPNPPAVGTKDRITIERMTRMWTNFAKTGDPTVEEDEFIWNITWKPATKDDLCYLKIGDELQLLPIEDHILSSI
ncbi:Esterase E4 [Eufriesea mexicana]|nr:Esterase E4 [Eufriesea mexicana]